MVPFTCMDPNLLTIIHDRIQLLDSSSQVTLYGVSITNGFPSFKIWFHSPAWTLTFLPLFMTEFSFLFLPPCCTPWSINNRWFSILYNMVSFTHIDPNLLTIIHDRIQLLDSSPQVALHGVSITDGFPSLRIWFHSPALTLTFLPSFITEFSFLIPPSYTLQTPCSSNNQWFSIL
jgi:hypothetical protein